MDSTLETEHRRRSAQILRYVANMHLQDDISASFVRPETPNAQDFFQGDNEDLLFTNESSRKLHLLQQNQKNRDGFQFYSSGESCWLRFTRSSSPSPPVPQDPDLHNYLNDWLAQTQSVSTLDALLTLKRIEKAPRISAGVSRQGENHIHSFLRHYQKFLHQLAYHRIAEPIYNTLFEWVHGETDHQLIWGLGHAKQVMDGCL